MGASNHQDFINTNHLYHEGYTEIAELKKSLEGHGKKILELRKKVSLAEERSLEVPALEAALQSSKDQFSRLTAKLSFTQEKPTEMGTICYALAEAQAKLAEVGDLLFSFLSLFLLTFHIFCLVRRSSANCIDPSVGGHSRSEASWQETLKKQVDIVKDQ